MTKRINNSSGRRVYDEKPYDANNSFVKKMATKMTDLIPQRSWISKWFNASGGNGEVSNDGDNADDQDIEEESLQPPAKRPRIRMDMTHPPGTFNIQPRGRAVTDKQEYTNDQYPIVNDTINDFLPPALVMRSNNAGARPFAASTPAIRIPTRSANTSRSDLTSLSQSEQQTPSANNVTVNGVDDNSESSESTSGCSSLIAQTNRQESMSKYINYPFAAKKGINNSLSNNDKMIFTHHLQSPRSLLFDSRDSASSRRPSFNYSIVSNGNNSGNNSVLSSPFYSGNTTFGGANAIANFRSGSFGDGVNNEFQLQVPKRASVRVKPNASTTTDSSGMSQTAKRILEALEHFSSPISDAKKIPVKTPLNNTLTSSGSKKRQREDDVPAVSQVGLRHLTRELSIPTVPAILKLKRRQRLQDTTLAARRIASAQNDSAPPLNVTQNNTTTTEYHLRTGESNDKKFFGKLRSSHTKKKVDIDEPAETVNLSNISLPITTLPNFNIKLAISPNNINTNNSSKLHDAKTLEKSNISLAPDTPPFKFSSPVKLSEPTKPIKSNPNFTFSDPINSETDQPKFNQDIKELKSPKHVTTTSSFPATNFMWSGSSTAPRPKEKKSNTAKDESIAAIDEGPAVALELRSGSVMDILGKESIKTVNIWECSECFIKNNDDVDQCIACKARKSNSKRIQSSSSSSSSSSGVSNFMTPVPSTNDGQFGAQFKMSNDRWECNQCLVRNPVTEIECLSCMAPRQKNKPDSGSLSTLTGSNVEPSNTAININNKNNNNIKITEETWLCPGCMLKNAVNVITCSCCSASKPGLVKINAKHLDEEKALGKTTKKSTWECPSCLLSNKSTASTCVSCTRCPDSLSSKSSTQTSSQASGFGDKFKAPVGAWTCDECMIQNKAEVTTCLACETPKSGSTTSKDSDKKSDSTLSFSFGIPSTSTQFKFGVPNTEVKKDDTPTNGFSFGMSSTQALTPSFSFGTPKSESVATTTGFTFGVSKTTSDGISVASSKADSGPTSSSVSSQGFSFGVPKKDDRKVEKSIDDAVRKPAFGINALKSETSSASIVFSKPPTGTEENNSSLQQAPNQPASSETKPAFSFVPPGSVVGGARNNNATISSAQSLNVSHASYTFSEPKISKSITAEIPAINFGASTSTAKSSAASTSTGFSFTTPKSTNNDQSGSSEKKPTLNFNNSTTPAPASGFPSLASEANLNDKSAILPFGMASNTDKTQGFGVDKTLPVFGIESKPLETPASAPAAFGADKPMFNTSLSAFARGPSSTPSGSLAPTPTPAPTSIFGTGSTLFGNNNNTSSGFGVPGTSTTSNIFPPIKSTETVAQTSGLFSFGASTPASSQQSTPAPAANTSGGFNFSATKTPFVFDNRTATPAAPAQPTSTPATGFGVSNFGASNTTPVSFPFNAPKNDSPSVFGQQSQAQPIPSIFNSQPAPLAIGQAATATSFASSTPGSSGFSFGTPDTGSTTATPSTGFNFNAPNTPASPSNGFNFSAGLKPSFNFTGGSGITTFNAQPQSAPPPRRIIKKAVRRMTPRTT